MQALAACPAGRCLSRACPAALLAGAAAEGEAVPNGTPSEEAEDSVALQRTWLPTLRDIQALDASVASRRALRRPLLSFAGQGGGVNSHV